MRVAIHTQIRQAMRVLIHTHISCRLLVEGSAPKPLLNTEFHSVAARSANALKWYAKAPFPFRCPGTNRPPYCLMAAVKHSGPRLMCGQNVYLSFSFTPHPVFCFCMVCRETRHPMVILGYPKMGPLWDNGVAKHHPIRNTF